MEDGTRERPFRLVVAEGTGEGGMVLVRLNEVHFLLDVDQALQLAEELDAHSIAMREEGEGS